MPHTVEQLAAEPTADRRRPARKGIYALTTGLVSLSLAACSSASTSLARSSGTTQRAATSNATLVYGSFNPLVEGFDPGLAQAAQFPLLEPIYNTLVHLGPGGTLSPELATSWQFTGPSNLTLRLTLRKGVTFTDGEPFNSAAVKANLERDMQLSGPEAAYLKPIKGITAVDPTTVDIHLSKPDASILAVFGDVIGMMAAPNAFADLKTDPVGTGGWIYSPARSVPGSHYVYVANPHYWDPSMQGFHEVRIDIISDETTIANALRAGQIDMAAIEPSDAATVEAAGLRVDPVAAGVAQVGILDLTGKLVPALANPLVRQAMNYAIDRPAIVKALMYGYGIPAAQYYPADFWGYNLALAKAYPYDPAKARQLLTEAGYPDGFSAQVVTLAPFSTDIQAIQAELAKVGIDMRIVIAPPGQLLHYMQSGRYPLWSDWGARNGANTDPGIPLTEAYAPNGPVNPFHYDNKALLALMTQGETATTTAARAPIYRQIDSLLTTQALALNVAINKVPYAYNPARITRPVVTAVGVVTIPDFYGLRPA